MVEESQGQGGLDGEIRVAPLPASPAAKLHLGVDQYRRAPARPTAGPRRAIPPPRPTPPPRRTRPPTPPRVASGAGCGPDLGRGGRPETDAPHGICGRSWPAYGPFRGPSPSLAAVDRRPIRRSAWTRSIVPHRSPRRPGTPAHSASLSRPTERGWTDGPPACGHQTGGTSAMTPHDTGSTGTPGTPRATAPPARTFGPQGPTLGELSDAYLQDYHVRQFRSPSTARGRIAHLVACFGRDARAAALTTYQIRQYQLARRAAGAATGTINRETSALHRMCTLAVHWGWLDTVPGFPDRLRENPPARASSSTPNTSPSAPTCPPRGRTSSTSPTTLAGARTRSSASPGTRSTKRAASSGSRPPVRRRWWGGFSRSHTPLPRPSPDGGHAATPTARWSSTATASPSAAGARRGAPPVRRPACRPASSMIAAAPPPAT